MTAQPFAVPEPISADDLRDAGLLDVGPGTVISPYARFVPRDRLGTLRPMVIGPRCMIGANTVLHGGVRLGEGVLLEDNVIVGQPEFGYAQRSHRSGAGTVTVIGPGAVVRAGAILYGGVNLGELTTVGHHTLLRTNVYVGSDSQLGHNLTIERCASIGESVRMSPGSHVTGGTSVGSHAFIGAGVRTIDSMDMTWRDPARQSALRPPHFGEAAKVGTGSTVLAGVLIGAEAFIGAGSVVTRDIPAGAVAYGVPARVRGKTATLSEEAS